MTKTIKQVSVLCLASLFFFMPRAYSVQEDVQKMARLEGAVLNIDNEPIPNTKIQLKHADSDQIYHSESNEKGNFSITLLPPGNYHVTIEKEGFKSFATEVKLQPGVIQPVEFILAKAETSEQKSEKEAVKSFKKGVEFARNNNPDSAIQAFNKAIELKPDLVEAHLNLGVLLFQQQKFDESEEVLLKAWELKPEELKCRQILGDINFEQAKTLIKENKIDGAIEELLQAYGFRPDHPFVNYLLGYLYFKKEMKNEAIKHFEAFLQLAPNASQAIQVKEFLTKLKNES